MGTKTLTKREKMDCMSQALQAELGGAVVTVATMQKIDSRCTENISRATYYRHLEYWEQEGILEPLEGVGVRIMQAPEPDDE